MQPFFEAIDRYEGIRDAIFQLANSALARRLQDDPQLAHLLGAHVRIGPIDNAALAATWAPTEFPWRELHEMFKPHVQRFEVAIWVNENVCALSYGRPSKGSDNVTIHFLERWMDDKNLLKGIAALLITDVAELYAIRLGKGSLKLKEPRPAARSTYTRLGFRPSKSIRGIDYMERGIER